MVHELTSASARRPSMQVPIPRAARWPELGQVRTRAVLFKLLFARSRDVRPRISFPQAHLNRAPPCKLQRSVTAYTAHPITRDQCAGSSSALPESFFGPCAFSRW